jgi:hypothetical protein
MGPAESAWSGRASCVNLGYIRSEWPGKSKPERKRMDFKATMRPCEDADAGRLRGVPLSQAIYSGE